ncbi:MAG TPA: hypothetical protein VHQ86_03750 [Candidatus Saccharimonadia bacterium]|nr:hypothetical protein [Candidatus Saccharimonadia bacterium]
MNDTQAWSAWAATCALGASSGSTMLVGCALGAAAGLEAGGAALDGPAELTAGAGDAGGAAVPLLALPELQALASRTTANRAVETRRVITLSLLVGDDAGHYTPTYTIEALAKLPVRRKLCDN